MILPKIYYQKIKNIFLGATAGLVFGLHLEQCLENERLRMRDQSEGGHSPVSPLSPPSGLDQKPSELHTSFVSLIETNKLVSFPIFGDITCSLPTYATLNF